MSERRLVRASEMTDAEIDGMLERFDQTKRPLQRRILVRFMADRTNLLLAAKLAIETHDLTLLQRAVEIAEAR